MKKEPKLLYFIALIPGSPLREEVRKFKLEMQKRFGASHALKSPAHITLQMPFRRPERDEAEIYRALEGAALDAGPFTVDLDGFDCFEPRVIFIRIGEHHRVIHLHELLKPKLSKLGLGDRELTSRLHPHMTIATRDLSKEAFYKAWPEMKTREFRRSFRVDHLYLLKHNGRFWDIHRRFQLTGP